MQTVVLTFNDADGFKDVPVSVDRYSAPAVADALMSAGWTLTSISNEDGPFADLAELVAFLDIYDPVQP
jgi:hypothetical protein